TEWFFATHPVDPDHFTMAVMLDLVERVEVGALERALRALAVQHDMLRLRVDEDGSRVLGVEEARFDLVVVDLEGVEPGDRERVVRERTETEQASLSLSEGPVVRAVLFREEGVDRLLLTAHHLVVDGVSWRVLLEDLGTAYRRSVEGSEVDLGPRSTPFPVWAERLARHTAEGGFDDELPFWRSLSEGEAVRSPGATGADHGQNTNATEDVVSVRLPEGVTRDLLREVPGVFRTRVNDVLLAALGRVLCEWS
ncbi:condensation domain-containing protein, partial [Nocardiopsis sp. JB363]|uniref:condensation domain-containing protein n=1 Tax=Nocardiopsis sp. JB363 TaxID=1434837 RepID=UPI001F363F80